MRPVKNIPITFFFCTVFAAFCSMGCGNTDQENAKPLPAAQDQIQRVQNNPNMSPEAKAATIKLLNNPVPNAGSQTGPVKP